MSHNEPRPFPNKRLTAVSKAALLGVLVAEALIGLDWLAYGMAEHGYLNKSWKSFFALIDLIQSVPSILVSEALGRDVNSANPYVVDGLIGLVVFAAVAAFWQFLVKGCEK